MWDMSDLIINTSGAPQPLAFAVPARYEDHERIIAALQRADPEGARAEMGAHILGTAAVIHPPAGGPGPYPAQS
jgi:DNA-binding FadR family transcriptional regulator